MIGCDGRTFIYLFYLTHYSKVFLLAVKICAAVRCNVKQCAEFGFKCEDRKKIRGRQSPIQLVEDFFGTNCKKFVCVLFFFSM